MFYVLLALYLIAFSLGIGLLILALLTYEKLRNKSFRDAGAVLIASTLLLLVDAARTYGRDAAGALDPPLLVFCLIFSILGNALMAFAVPRLAFRLVDLPVSPGIWALHLALVVIAAGVGLLKERLGGALFGTVSSAFIAALYGYAGAVVIARFDRVADPALRSLLRALLILGALLLALVAAQLAVIGTSALPLLPWREAPLAQIVCQIAAASLALLFAVRYMYRPAGGDDLAIPAEFVKRFGISNREWEIITLVVQGYSHKQIGEKLFISARTVKNHVYNIYQKTSAENKVQLLNLIRSNGERK